MPSYLNARGSNAAGRQRLIQNATIALISIICIVMVGHDLVRTWDDRSHRLDEGRREAMNLALSSHQYTEDVFRLAAISLIDLAERVETDGTGPARIDRLRRLMMQQLANVSALHSLDVVDETGAIVVDSRSITSKIDVADRDYFRYHQTHSDRETYVGPPVVSRISGNWVIVVSRRVDHADHSFAGVVAATIDVAYFEKFYTTMDLGHDGSASLLRDDGTLLVRRPLAVASIGTRRRLVPPFNDLLPKPPNGTYNIVSSLDGIARVYAWRQVTGYPLVVGVALGEEEMLADWRIGAAEHLLAAAMIALLLGVIGVRLVIQVRLRARAERQAEAAAATAETAAAQYRLLADNSSDMIATLDLRFVYQYVSPGCRDLLGFEPAGLIGETSLSLIISEDVAPVTKCLHDLACGQDCNRTTCRVRHRDGHSVWVDISFKLIRNPDTGAPREIQSAMRDITERMETLAALQDSEERFRLLLQSSAVTEAIYLLDLDGNVETWNAAAERIKGYRPEEIIGRNFSVFFTPEEIAGGEPARELARAIDSGTSDTEGWRVRKNGSRFLAHVIIDTIHNEDGSLRGFVKATKDITNQRIEDEQREIIIEAAPNGMLIINEAGIITLANSQVERIFDYPNGALIGQPLEILVPEQFRAAHGTLHSAFTGWPSDKRAPQQELTGRKRDGSPVTIEIMLSPVETPRGSIVIAALFDVTDRIRLAAERQESEKRERLTIEATNASLERLSRHLVEARDRAEQANRAKSRFLAGISHELRTPLNGILGYAHLLHIEGGLSPVQTVRVDAMLEAGKHLLEMITCVLDLSEIEAEHVSLRPAWLDVRVIALACLDLVRPMAEAKGLALGVTMAPGTSPELIADPTRLRQILLNLLGNAAKFTRQGTVDVHLQTVTGRSALRIEVVDTGPGISTDLRNRLFQDFERLDTEPTRTVEGAGLGLALSSRLAALMGGKLGYEDNPNGGSIFWLELPSTVSAAQTVTTFITAAPDAGTEPAPIRPFLVLVVDDVLMNREIASSFLRSAGHSVVCVDGGAEAVAAAAVTDFDVVLMDVRMPGMDGLEATRRIRASPGSRGRVPIVALTAQAFTEQVEACRAAGMGSHLSKPFDPETLLVAVAQAFARGLASSQAIPVPMPTTVPATPRLPVSAPSSASPAPASSVIGFDLPILDRTAFVRTTSFLPPITVTTHLRTIVELGDSLLQHLRMPDAIMLPATELTDRVHSLAGSSGMFGFKRLSSVGRRFERALQTASGEAPAIGAGLIAALEATLQVIHELDPAAVTPAA